MSTRKEVHKELIQTRELLRCTDGEDESRALIEENIRNLRKKMIKVTAETVDFPERLDFILSHRGFKEVLDAFWFVLTPYIDENEALSKEGYIKLKHALQKSLEGHEMSFNETETDWVQDGIIYGELVKYSLFQLLYDGIGKRSYLSTTHETFISK